MGRREVGSRVGVGGIGRMEGVSRRERGRGRVGVREGWVGF